jgi:hypothetical protein
MFVSGAAIVDFYFRISPSYFPLPVSILAFQIRCDFGELGEGGLEIFDDLSM